MLFLGGFDTCRSFSILNFITKLFTVPCIISFWILGGQIDE